MSTTLKAHLDLRAEVMALTVEQYHQMINQGILPEGEPFELIDGYLLRKDRSAAGEDLRTVGHEHATAVAALGDLNPKVQKLGCHVRVQQPLTLPPYDEPEPDGTIVYGSRKAYSGRHPQAADVVCVIEVADSSLARDRAKARIYASAGIPQYLIVNLPDRAVEQYRDLSGGKYRETIKLDAAQSVEIPIRGRKKLVVRVRALLP